MAIVRKLKPAADDQKCVVKLPKTCVSGVTADLFGLIGAIRVIARAV